MMAYVTDERGRYGHFEQAADKPLSSPSAEVRLPPPVYSELGDGRVKVSKPDGEVLGLFVNRQIAERTMQTLQT